MPQSYSNIPIHMVFSTKERRPHLLAEHRPELHAYFITTLKNHNCQAIAIGSVEDHVHLLFRISRVASVSEIAENVKSHSSRWLKSQHFQNFAWQGGYGAFAIGRSELEAATRFVLSQEEHHRRETFQEEFVRLLLEHDVEYDEKYLWV